MAPKEELLSSWIARKDNQIMGLELLSIALGASGNDVLSCLCAASLHVPGVSSFSSRLRGKNVIIHSDNAGAEHALRKGS